MSSKINTGYDNCSITATGTNNNLNPTTTLPTTTPPTTSPIPPTSTVIPTTTVTPPTTVSIPTTSNSMIKPLPQPTPQSVLFEYSKYANILNYALIEFIMSKLDVDAFGQARGSQTWFTTSPTIQGGFCQYKEEEFGKPKHTSSSPKELKYWPFRYLSRFISENRKIVLHNFSQDFSSVSFDRFSNLSYKICFFLQQCSAGVSDHFIEMNIKELERGFKWGKYLMLLMQVEKGPHAEQLERMYMEHRKLWDPLEQTAIILQSPRVQEQIQLEVGEIRKQMQAEFAEYRKTLQSEFAEYRKNLQSEFAEFAEYRKNLQSEFAEYQKNLQSEFAEYQKKLRSESAENRQNLQLESAENRQNLQLESAENRKNLQSESAENRKKLELELAEIRQQKQAENQQLQASYQQTLAEFHQNYRKSILELKDMSYFQMHKNFKFMMDAYVSDKEDNKVKAQIESAENLRNHAENTEANVQILKKKRSLNNSKDDEEQEEESVGSPEEESEKESKNKRNKKEKKDEKHKEKDKEKKSRNKKEA